MTDQPTIRIERGWPSDEELAALMALLTAATDSGGATEVAPPIRGRWADPAGLVRRFGSTGPGGWRAARY